jgi:hypothetical protein
MMETDDLEFLEEAASSLRTPMEEFEAFMPGASPADRELFKTLVELAKQKESSKDTLECIRVWFKHHERIKAVSLPALYKMMGQMCGVMGQQRFLIQLVSNPILAAMIQMLVAYAYCLGRYDEQRLDEER